jgi:hypothetical protein
VGISELKRTRCLCLTAAGAVNVRTSAWMRRTCMAWPRPESGEVRHWPGIGVHRSAIGVHGLGERHAQTSAASARPRAAGLQVGCRGARPRGGASLTLWTPQPGPRMTRPGAQRGAAGPGCAHHGARSAAPWRVRDAHGAVRGVHGRRARAAWRRPGDQLAGGVRLRRSGGGIAPSRGHGQRNPMCG